MVLSLGTPSSDSLAYVQNPALKAASSARKTTFRRIAIVLASIVGLWALLGFLATLPVTGNHAYWRRFQVLPEDFHLKVESVSFSSLDEISLKGWYIQAEGVSHATVILAHGINGNRSDMLPRAAILVRHRFNALLIDLRDHGESGGNYTGPVLGVLKVLKNRGQLGPLRNVTPNRFAN